MGGTPPTDTSNILVRLNKIENFFFNLEFSWIFQKSTYPPPPPLLPKSRIFLEIYLSPSWILMVRKYCIQYKFYSKVDSQLDWNWVVKSLNIAQIDIQKIRKNVLKSVLQFSRQICTFINQFYFMSICTMFVLFWFHNKRNACILWKLFNCLIVWLTDFYKTIF